MEKKTQGEKITDLKTKAESGDGDAALALSQEYQFKDSPEYDLALSWRDKSAELGNPEAQFSCAQSLLFPRPNRDPVQGLEWMKKSANGGWLPAIIELSAMYREGKDVKKNEPEGLVWLIKAAELRHPDSLMEAASIAESRGDLQEAYQWLSLATEVYAYGSVDSLRELKENLSREEIETARRRVDDFKAGKPPA